MKRRTANRLVDAWLRGRRSACDAVLAAQAFFRRKARAAQRRAVAHVPGPDEHQRRLDELAHDAPGAPWPVIVAESSDVEFVMAPHGPLLEVVVAQDALRAVGALPRIPAELLRWHEEPLVPWVDGAQIPLVAGDPLSPVAPPPSGE